MGNKLEVIGANLVPDTPASFSSAPKQITPVSALDDAKAAKKYDDNKFDKLFSWETPKAVLEGMPTMGILNVAADKISPYIPEVKISDTLSFGGQGPLITNSQPVTDERLEQYAKSMNVPEEYWQDLRSSKDMTEVYIKTGRILSDIKGQQHLAQVYGSTALTMGSVFFDPTFYLGNEAGNLMAASVKSASIAKSLAAVGALKQTTVATKVAEAVSSMGKALPAQASAVASKAASVTEAAAGKSGGFLVDTLNYSGTNVLLGELDANVRGRETTPTEFYMNALVGAVAPHVIGALGKTYTASNAWLHNRTVKALNEIGAKAAQEKFQVEPTDKLNEMTIGEKVSHGDEAIEPRLSDTGPAQGELFDATGPQPKDPQLDSMVRALLGDEPVMTEGVAPEGQLELDFLGEPKRVPVETPEVAPVVETTPVVEAEPVASPDVPTEIETPKELLRARPSYTLDGVRFTPRFKSSIDKALFIVGMDARSAHDSKYMEMLRKVFPKLSDAEIREAGQGIKAQHMRSNAKVAIETKGLPRGTDAELPVETTWKDAVNPEGKDFEPTHVAVEPVVPKEGLQPEQVAELEKATPEVQQKVVQKVLDQKVADTLHPSLEGFPALGVSREVRDGPLFKGNASLIKGLDHAVSSLGKLDSIGLHFNFKKPVEVKYSFESGGSTVEATGVIKAIQRGTIQDFDGELTVKVQMVREGYSRAAWVDLPIATVAKALKAEPMEYAPKAPALEATHKAPHEVRGEHNLPVGEPTVIPAADQKAINKNDIVGAGEVANMVKGKPVSGDGFVAIEQTTNGPVTLYSQSSYKVPWGSGKSIPRAEMVKGTKEPIRIVAVHPDPVLIPNELYPGSGDFAFFKVKAILPGEETPQETLVKAKAFEGTTPSKAPSSTEAPIKSTVAKKSRVAEDIIDWDSIDWDSALLAPFKDSKMLSKKSAYFWKGKTWKEIGVLVTDSTDVSLSTRMKEDEGNGGTTSLFAPSKVVKEYFLTDGRHNTTLPKEVGEYIEALKAQKALNQKVLDEKQKRIDDFKYRYNEEILRELLSESRVTPEEGARNHFAKVTDYEKELWTKRMDYPERAMQGAFWAIHQMGEKKFALSVRGTRDKTVKTLEEAKQIVKERLQAMPEPSINDYAAGIKERAKTLKAEWDEFDKGYTEAFGEPPQFGPKPSAEPTVEPPVKSEVNTTGNLIDQSRVNDTQYIQGVLSKFVKEAELAANSGKGHEVTFKLANGTESKYSLFADPDMNLDLFRTMGKKGAVEWNIKETGGEILKDPMGSFKALDQKVEIKTDYGMNDHFTAALEADLNAWKARENIQDSDTEGYGWEIRKTGLHGALRLLTFFPGKGRVDFDIKSQAEGIAKIRGMIADAPNDQLNIQKRWDAFNEEASKVQQQVVQKDVAPKAEATVIPAADQKAYDELVAPKFNDKVSRLEQLLSKDKLTSDDMKLMDSLAQDPDGWGNQTGGVLLITPEQGAKLKALKDARKVDAEKYSELSAALATLKEKQVRFQRKMDGADDFNVKHGAELVELEEELFQLTRRMSGKQSLENLLRRQLFRNDARVVGEATIENGELHLETAGRSFQSFEELPQVPSGRVFIKTKSPAYPIETTVITQKGQVFPTVTVRVPDGFSKTITGKPLQEAMATLQDALRKGLKGNVDYSTPSINEALSAERLAGLKKAGFKKETTDTERKQSGFITPEVISKRLNRYVGGDESWTNKFIKEMPAELRAEIEKDITEAAAVYRKARDAHDARDSAKTDAAMAIHNDMEEAILKKLKEYRDTVEAAYVAKEVALSRQFHELNAESRKNHMAYLKKDLAALNTAAVGEPISGKNFWVGADASKMWWTAHSNGKKGEMHLGLYGNEVEAWKKAVADAKRMLQDEVKAEKAARKENRSEKPFDEAAATLQAKEQFETERWRGQSGFITPGVALGLLAGSGLGVYAVGQASQGKDLKETLGSALSALGSIAIIGMTKGNKSVVEALAHGKTLADVVKLPEVKANPEAVTLKTAQGQDLKLIDLAAKTGRLTDGTPFHMGTIKLPFFGKTRVSDPSGEISAEIRNSDSETGRSLGNLIASSIAGHKTKGAMNHTTADVYAQSTAKSAIHAVGDAFDKGFIAWANRDGKVSPDFIKAYSKKLVTEFNDQVVRAKKGETEGVHPEAIKAAKAIADSEARLLQMAADLLKEGKARGVVAEGSAWDLTGQIVAEPTYVHRSASSRGLYELTASVGIEKVHLLIQRALQKGNPELSPQFAAEMAPAYAKTLASLEHYPGLKVNDMNPDELLQHIKDVTQLTSEKAEELSKLFMGHKAADGVSGILKKRTQLDDTFEMPTTDLQGNPVTISMRQLFNQDIRMNHAHWVNSVSGVLGMARVSLDAGVDLTHGATFQRLLDQMKGELLEKSVPYNRAMKQVDTIRDLHAKILGKQNAEGIFKPANEAIRLLNDTTTLLSHAGFVFSAGAELAAAVQRRGLEAALNDMPELGQVVKAALGGEIDDGLARSLITAHALGDHQTAAMQLGLEQGNLSGASGAVQTAIGQTAKMNFFSTATASTKYLAIKAALQELSDVARGVRTLTPEQWNHFKLRGMSQELLEEIKPALLKATTVDENGMLLTDGSGYRPLDMFKDNAKAAMDLHAHLDRQGNAAASESSGAGETNRYMHNDIGRTLGKFQGTPLIMTAKLKGNLNNFDASVAASWITTSLGAALAYIMSTYISNHGDQETMKKKLTTKEIAKAAFRNGFSGIAPNVIDLAATMTGQEAPFAGVTNSGRQGGVDVPAFRTIQRVKDTAATVGHALTGQQVTRAEAAQAVKTPLWALNAFIPFATQSLPKKRTDKPKD